MEVVFGMKIVVLMIVEVMEVDEMMDTMVEEGLKYNMEILHWRSPWRLYWTVTWWRWTRR